MKTQVAILGCTGLVGQELIRLLTDHPYFEIAELQASERSAGIVMNGISVGAVGTPIRSSLVFSALPTEIAREIEPKLAKEGKLVITKSSTFRMESDVPILIPEVNPEHLSILAAQRAKRGWKGAIITDPNCTTTVLALALKPLQDAFGIESVMVTTMQALSGAGVRGVGAMEILDNVIPHIDGEEEKVEGEATKILGSVVSEEVIVPANICVRASCHRVNVSHGHMESVHVRLKKEASMEEVKRVLSSFSGEPQRLSLPHAPLHPVIVREEANRPQPKIDRDAGGGMSVSIGKLKQGIDSHSWMFDVLGHNLIRGAAGASVLDAEFLYKTGMLASLLNEQEMQVMEVKARK